MKACLRKKGKSQEFIKNLRPLSMLSVIYKIVSASIANRIKPYLNHLISHSQNAFVSVRYIGESTRLVYDIMQDAIRVASGSFWRPSLFGFSVFI